MRQKSECTRMTYSRAPSNMIWKKTVIVVAVCRVDVASNFSASCISWSWPPCTTQSRGLPR